MSELDEVLSKETCWNCGEKIIDVYMDIDYRKFPIAVVWFDEGSPGGKYEPPEPASVYVECWRCFQKRLKNIIPKEADSDGFKS